MTPSLMLTTNPPLTTTTHSCTRCPMPPQLQLHTNHSALHPKLLVDELHILLHLKLIAQNLRFPLLLHPIAITWPMMIQAQATKASVIMMLRMTTLVTMQPLLPPP